MKTLAPDTRTDLAAGRLGEPEGPVVHQRVLDIEVILVMENCDSIFPLDSGGWDVIALGRDGDCGEVDLCRHLEFATVRVAKESDWG